MRVGLLVLAMSGCVSIPPYQGASPDASADGAGDATPSPLAIRLIGNAYHDSNGTGTSGMTVTGYTIATTGVVDGDLVLFIGNIDNGVEDFWKLPAGFTPIANHTFGPDGQSYVVAWKIAAGEPTIYANDYRTTMTSSAAALTLLAVSGYDAAAPIEASLKWDQPAYADPADVGSPGITTTVDHSLIVFVAGADWYPANGSNTFAPPAGFTVLESLGDRNTNWEWTSQSMATKMQDVAGPTGALVSTMAGTTFPAGTPAISGAGWSVVFAIAPAH